ncbi:MAG TPA: PilZ domain-containing protein [Candidatus Methylomirabilis sp.]|nr:PilZ domain-containing protein [Candidatus Methylomirabilis sp.]
MNDSNHYNGKLAGARGSPRVYSVREITLSYEGQDDQIVVKPPNLSVRGMFVNTNQSFPEGAILNLRFSLALTGAEIRTRGEVRYCQPGVGVGVEFIGLAQDAVELIEREVSLTGKGAVRRPTRKPSKKPLKKSVTRARAKRHR